VYIYIPEGFPGEGEIARLDKAAYGTKQGARRFYDFSAETLIKIGMKQCSIEPCLFQFNPSKGEECFLLQYVDDSLIARTKEAIRQLQHKLNKHLFKCKFQKPKDFLGMDIEHKALGQVTLSMSTFTEKLQQAFDLKDNVWGGLQTPGRTDKKIVRGQNPEKIEQYRSHVGAMNRLTMCLRYDLAYTTKELSRVLQEPTKTANETLRRAINYTIQTKHAHLQFNHSAMLNYKPPKTRRKPTDTESATYDTEYNLQDGIPQVDDQQQEQNYKYTKPHINQVCFTDIDLAGQVETRQSTSGLMIYLNGTLVHWRARTERLIIQATAAGE
jgi:hypothetical protein